MWPTLVVAVLTLAVFLNAALLFSVEPMFSKLALPLLGGTPAVWNTCLVFFQAALLAGYAYAHFSVRLLGPRRQAMLHVALLALSLAALPLQLRTAAPPPAGSSSVVWLLILLTRSLGVPFVLLASGAPLAQRWFAASGHVRSSDPYFLYAASNLGSMLALLAYPFLIEPQLPLVAQRMTWSLGYAFAAALVAFSAWLTTRGVSNDSAVSVHPGIPRASSSPTVTTRDRMTWIAYSAVPSSLLMGVTSYISTDVGAITLLWVIPLALYLLTFVLVFAARAPLQHRWMVLAQSQFLVVLPLALFWGVRLPGLTSIALHVGALFIIAMVCHGELARKRPGAEHLTEFFLWIAVGGLAGGVFNALAAPLLFNEIREYPIALIAAAFLRPGPRGGSRLNRTADLLLPAILGITLAIAVSQGGMPLQLGLTLMMLAAGVSLFSFRNRPVRLGLGLAALFAVGHLRATSTVGGTRPVATERSFFGVLRVADGTDGTVRTMRHGTTLHGAQRLAPSKALEPLTYYHRDGPAGDVFSLSAVAALARRRVGIVGLGAGTLACYGRPGEQWVFFEIDPLVGKMASDPKLFTFLTRCAPAVRVVFGDARLSLARIPPAAFDILVLDAFSSDAIPVHLLTREALKLYLNALAPGGVIAIHISNHYMEIEPVVAVAARELGLATRIRSDVAITPTTQVTTGRAPSEWVVLARAEKDLGRIAAHARWVTPRTRKGVETWTDDFSNVVEILKWR